MRDFNRILLATDLSACSRGAEQTALSLARSLSAEVLVLHVVELPPGLDPETVIHPDLEGPAQPIREYVTTADRGALRDLAASFRAAGLTVTDSISVGPIAATLYAYRAQGREERKARAAKTEERS